jgi:hypothetical protein
MGPHRAIKLVCHLQGNIGHTSADLPCQNVGRPLTNDIAHDAGKCRNKHSSDQRDLDTDTHLRKAFHSQSSHFPTDSLICDCPIYMPSFLRHAAYRVLHIRPRSRLFKTNGENIFQSHLTFGMMAPNILKNR